MAETSAQAARRAMLEGLATLGVDDVPLAIPSVGDVENLDSIDLRNGRIEDVKSLLVKATIGTHWHWRPIRNMPPTEAHKHIGAYIQQALASMTVAGSLPGTLTTIQARKSAIIVGTARAVTTQFYRIEEGDIIPGERAEPWLEAKRNPDGEIKIVARAGVPAANLDILNTPLVLTAAEALAIPALHMCAIGLLPVQGYSLVMTGHHYLSDPKSQSFKAMNVMERAHWTSRELSEWWTPELTSNRDALWHKVGHPVNLSLKIGLAFDGSMPAKLVKAGAGPAASRLPAVETELRAANSYVSLLATVNPLITSYGGKLDYEKLTQAIDMTKLFRAEAPSEVIQVVHPREYPTHVNTRATAVGYLQTVMDRNKDIVAYCFGFYCALSDATAMMGATNVVDTLKTSYALTKLRSQSFASYTAGAVAYGDYNAARNAARAAGEFNPPIYVMK